MNPATLVLICSVLVLSSATPGPLWAANGDAAAGLRLVSARVAIEGTSNLHDYAAATTDVSLTTLEVGDPAADPLDRVLQPGAIRELEVVIPAASLESAKKGIDKNMHRALKAKQYPDIRFQLDTFEPIEAGYRAIGRLTIAGVQREVTLTVRAQRDESALVVTGETDLLMTDYGVKPPRAMLGLLKTNPRVQVHLAMRLVAPVT